MSAPLIEASELTKHFGSVQALTGLSFQVMPGEIYGLLGPNGAGKTTTIKVITGLVEPTSGSVKVEGFDPVENPIEVKSTRRPRLADARSLALFRREYGELAGPGLLIHTGDELEWIADGILACPLWRVI